MTTLTLTHIPPRTEPLSDFIAAIAEAATRHLHAQVVTHNVHPPRFEMTAAEVQVRSFARVWLDAHGVEWDVVGGEGSR